MRPSANDPRNHTKCSTKLFVLVRVISWIVLPDDSQTMTLTALALTWNTALLGVLLLSESKL